MRELRYKELETTLARVLYIRSRDIGAFRARLRHLRNIGVPRLPSPGSGRRIEYSHRQAFELLVALELEKLGTAPKKAAILAGTIVSQSPYGQYKGEDCYAVVGESRPGVTMVYGLKAFLEFLQSAPDVFAVINVSACVRRLERELTRVIGN